MIAIDHDPTAVPVCESALAMIDKLGIRLELCTPDDLFNALHDELFDRDILRQYGDYDPTTDPWEPVR